MKHEISVSICFLALGVLLMPHSVEAKSALAIGLPDSVAAQGIAFGEGYNYDTTTEAEARALKECLAQQDAPATTRNLCKIVDHFDNQCVAVSLDPKPGTPGYGWSIASTLDVAKAHAIANCRLTAGSDRADYCVISLSDCDTKG